MTYPDLGDWVNSLPIDAEQDGVEMAALLAWTSIDQLTAGRLAFDPITVRPVVVEDDGGVRLAGPVGGVQGILIDGVPFIAYRVEGNSIYRLDEDAWPTNEDMTLPSGATGVFEVSYWHGWRPGRQLIWAAAVLAKEFYLAAIGGQKTRLPKGTTQVQRQGVTFDVSKPIFDQGQTGIREVDVILGRYNPERLRSMTVVASPETLARAPRRF